MFFAASFSTRTMRRSLRLGLTAAVTGLVAACGASLALTPTGGVSASGAVGETIRIEFQLSTADDRPRVGAIVTFTLEGAPDGVSIRPSTATTDSRGLVTAIVTLDGAGTFDVVASASDAPPASVSVTVTDGPDTLYKPCESAADCNGQACIEVSTEGRHGFICSRNCETVDQCTSVPLGVACLDPNGGGVCFPICRMGADCAVGQQCATFTDQLNNSAQVCLP